MTIYTFELRPTFDSIDTKLSPTSLVANKDEIHITYCYDSGTQIKWVVKDKIAILNRQYSITEQKCHYIQIIKATISLNKEGTIMINVLTDDSKIYRRDKFPYNVVALPYDLTLSEMEKALLERNDNRGIYTKYMDTVTKTHFWVHIIPNTDGAAGNLYMLNVFSMSHMQMRDINLLVTLFNTLYSNGILVYINSTANYENNNYEYSIVYGNKNWIICIATTPTDVVINEKEITGLMDCIDAANSCYTETEETKTG